AIRQSHQPRPQRDEAALELKSAECSCGGEGLAQTHPGMRLLREERQSSEGRVEFSHIPKAHPEVVCTSAAERAAWTRSGRPMPLSGSHPLGRAPREIPKRTELRAEAP